MIVLALDTALAAVGVAVLDGERVLAACCEPMERGHQERLGGLVRGAMTAARTGFGDLERIGVTVGPGSFTGVRVGVAFAKGLALALDIPCVGIGTLQALAASVEAPGTARGGIIAAAVDARRGQVYLQLFKPGGGGPAKTLEALTAPEALSLEQAQARLDHWSGVGPVTAVGSGAGLLRFGEAALAADRLVADPAAVARLAAAAAAPMARPRPLYLRAPDARTIAERAAS